MFKTKPVFLGLSGSHQLPMKYYLLRNSQVYIAWHKFSTDTFYSLFTLKVIYLIDNSPVFYKLFHLPSLHSSFHFATYHYWGQGRQTAKESIVFGIFLPLYFVPWCARLRGRRYRESMHTYYKLIIVFYKFTF